MHRHVWFRFQYNFNSNIGRFFTCMKNIHFQVLKICIRIRVICKVTLSLDLLSPPPWYPQTKEILLNLRMEGWNSAFNAQGSRVIILVVQIGEVKIYVALAETLKKKERQDETQFITEIAEKLVWIPIISFCKIFIPSYAFDALLSRSWPSMGRYRELSCLSSSSNSTHKNGTGDPSLVLQKHKIWFLVTIQKFRPSSDPVPTNSDWNQWLVSN